MSNQSPSYAELAHNSYMPELRLTLDEVERIVITTDEIFRLVIDWVNMYHSLQEIGMGPPNRD